MDIAQIDRPGCCAEEPSDTEQRARCVAVALACGISAELLWNAYRRNPANRVVKRPDLGALSTSEWKTVRKHLTEHVLGATGESPRVFLDCMLWRVRHNRAAWRGMPSVFGSGDNIRQRHVRWVEKGVYDGLLTGVLADKGLSADRRAEFELLAAVVEFDMARYRERHDDNGSES